MKNMKSKLLASVAMLLVSAIMLTSASFAWFTISTAPEVKGITTTVVTNETLEIALDNVANKTAADVDTASVYAAGNIQSGNYYTWGNLVNLAAEKDKTNAAAAAYAALDKTLRPATLDTTFMAPTYGDDGRISNLTNALTAVAAPDAAANGFGLLIDDTDSDNTYDAGEYVYGYYIDYWMRSNVGGSVTLSTAADRDGSSTTKAEGDNTFGEGSTFEANSTVADDASPEEKAAIKKANETLAANIAIAFQDVTPTNAETGAPITTGTITKATTKQDTTNKETATFEGNVTTLTANQAKLIRVYVYLEGAAVKNDAASIDGQAITGALNLQFTIAATEGVNGVDKSMLTEQTTVKAE